MRILVVFDSLAPYHHARIRALQILVGKENVLPVQISDNSSTYEWEKMPVSRRAYEVRAVTTKTPFEKASSLLVFLKLRRITRLFRPDVALVQSYWPPPLASALITMVWMGVPRVLMTDSHAATSHATGFRAWFKSRLVRLYQSGLLAGRPHIRYFASLGLDARKLYAGYDSVDNDYYSRGAEVARSNAIDVRSALELPDKYFLSLGRMVWEKNLDTLINAYAIFLRRNPASQVNLVLVGSGILEEALKSQALRHGLKIYMHPNNAAPITAAGVHFYGRRSIEETPRFHALAHAFVLPSISDTWGLVVNEAMACGLPVIVSEAAGCAEDLVVRDNICERIGKNGFVFNPTSPEELADCMTLLANNDALRIRMGAVSAMHIKRYSCEVFAENALRAARAAMTST